jgi:hypothetical protein
LLARAVLPPGLTDSRLLPSRVGKRVRLARVVAAAKEAPGGERHTVKRSLAKLKRWGLLGNRRRAARAPPGARSS